MSTSYYFTGTRSQLLEKLETFDKQADFKEDEMTFKIDVVDLGTGGEFDADATDRELSDPPLDKEGAKPASKEGETKDRGSAGTTAKTK